MLSGKSEKAVHVNERTTFGDLVELHIEDMRDVDKSPRRSKRKSLEKLKRDLGRIARRDVSRERLIAFGKARTVLEQATAIHGIETPTDRRRAYSGYRTSA